MLLVVAMISYTGFRSSTPSGSVRNFKDFELNLEGYICQILSGVARATPLVGRRAKRCSEVLRIGIKLEVGPVNLAISVQSFHAGSESLNCRMIRSIV